MKYRIPVLSSVMMSTTACLSGEPIEGEWTLGDSDSLCMEYQKTYTYDGVEVSYSMEICLTVAQMDFSVTSPEADVLTAELTAGNGTIDIGYSYTDGDGMESGSYSYDFSIGSGIDLELVSEDAYKMTLEVTLETDDEETPVDVELSCTLTDKKSMTCQQSDLIVEDESYGERYDFSGALNFTK